MRIAAASDPEGEGAGVVVEHQIGIRGVSGSRFAERIGGNDKFWHCELGLGRIVDVNVKPVSDLSVKGGLELLRADVP